MSLDAVIFDPLLPFWLMGALALAMLAVLVFAVFRRLTGWPYRGFALVCVFLALLNPSLKTEERQAKADIVIVVVDRSSSQMLSDRAAQTQAALAHVTQQLADRPGTEMRLVEVEDAAGPGGSEVMSALAQVLSETARDRIAGAIVISDGQIHDTEFAPKLPAPLHLLLTGQPRDWDRRLVVKNAPGFAILGEPITLTLLVEDQGAAPQAAFADLILSVDGGPEQRYQIPVNREVEVDVSLGHGGINILQFSTPDMSGELTDRNNAAVVQINALRDRLRVLLVSGVPHPGERTWRNLLKSDSNVDLVHFTILRPPEKRDGVPVTELSLIAFPTRELFLEKIGEFDLIVFDRYKRRGLLPTEYFESITNYVRQGGAVLVAAGPDYAGANSLYRSPLGAILPGRPTSRVFEEPITPKVTEFGLKHPVSESLERFAPDIGWGRWLRQIEVETTSGQVLMTGRGESPLLIVDRVGEGRVALLASDHAWLWDRGYEGGGPQAELLRRVAHWSMKEPDLEEEALLAQPMESGLLVMRRSLTEGSLAPLEITKPNGTQLTIALQPVAPGRYEAEIVSEDLGLYRLGSGDLEIVAALGPAAPREFVQTIATDRVMAPILAKTNGGALALSEGLPKFRNIRNGRPSHGRGWIGLVSREAYVVQGVEIGQFLPAWVYLIFASLGLLAGWLREGRWGK
ncbi:hypothetical protein [uncultured Planktomarina sp.]|uniref:hypothetical protein n=1 Tax=uncultured Planktomarina sp. TaxID=1538529 RepID=UPI003260EEBF